MIDLPAARRERIAAGVLVGAAVLFVGSGIPRLASAGFGGALTLPLVLLAADLLIATALLTWWYPVRPVAQGLAVFGILVHALVLLRSGPVWTRGCSAVLAVAHVCALVLLFMLTAAEDDELDEDAEYAEPDEPVPPDEPESPLARPVEATLETPVAEVLDTPAPVVEVLTSEPDELASEAETLAGEPEEQTR